MKKKEKEGEQGNLPRKNTRLNLKPSLGNVARQGSIPVFYTTIQYTSPTLADAGLFYAKSKSLAVWLEGDERRLGDWMPGLVPDARHGDRVIAKKYPSAFFGTTLATELNLRNVDTVVLCGVSTSGCVRASALDAMCCGFRPMVSFRF